MARQLARETSRTPGQPNPDNTAVLLRQAYVVIDRLVPARLAEVGHSAIRVAHGAVLQNLDEGGTTVSALAERAGMTKQAMAELVQYLERHGYVRRAPDPADRRAKLVVPTDQGREVIAIASGLVPEMERRLIEERGRSRWRQLRDDLRTIDRLFQQNQE